MSVNGSLKLTIDVDTHVSIDIDHRFFLLANFAISSCGLCLQMTDKERRTKRHFDRPSSSSAPPPPPETDRDPWSRENEGEPLGTFEHYADPHAAVKDIKCIPTAKSKMRGTTLTAYSTMSG
ncbi:hypothetical protein DY000_02049294 [Brassica cretica]|uniref:Uncharacterized protein n=1 Tax=Brassica cretica TaxID=69181 RepID=A0ABQ7F044_BRACR|nr:hypothetical protein DY000_02049294 [Brassica cretica]